MTGDLAGRIPVETVGYHRGITPHLLRPGGAALTDRDQTVRMNIEIATETGIAITSHRGREGVEVLA
jgi:hypothetical protein